MSTPEWRRTLEASRRSLPADFVPCLLAPRMGGIRPDGVRVDPEGRVIVDIEL